MASSVERACRSKVSLFSRVAGTFIKDVKRSCHVSVEEPPARLTNNKPTMVTAMTRPLKQSRNRLLSDRMSSAVTVHPLNAVRPYSALPQRAIFTSPFWQHDDQPEDHTGSPEGHRKCWKCGRETDALKELFFCHCGVVQTPATKVTFFSLFGMAEKFDLDLKRLSEQFKELQKRLHPDMYSQKSETEQSLAEQQSALLNKAYFTLLRPVPRAHYLLELCGYVIEEGTTSMDPEFLMEVLDLNERIGEGTAADVQDIEADIASRIEENIQLFASAYAAADYETAREISARLNYFVNVESKVKMFYRERM